jgi:hypothetical protein
MFQSQERVTVEMAHQLESLAKHFEQMESALREHEAGEELGEEDIVGMCVIRPRTAVCGRMYVYAFAHGCRDES